MVDKDVYTQKPSMFLRKSSKEGLYFFSPKQTTIYYMSGRHVQELLAGQREFVCIYKSKVKKGDNQ